MGITENHILAINVDKLVDQGLGLFVVGNSGSGKSHALRGILEKSSGQIQQIVFDSEGEFGTLRAKFDYLLAAKTRTSGADIVLSVPTASLLCQRVMETNVSVILDISDLTPVERTEYVAAFVSQLLETPVANRRPCLVVIDEVHRFAPQGGKAPPSKAAIADLIALGRKRGLIPIVATQRIAKADKDAVSEIPNKLVGRITLDVDADRASDDLGLRAGDKEKLKQLPRGHFFAQGPLLFDAVTVVQTGPNQTHPPALGTSNPVVPPTPEAIQHLLDKFADLPEEAREQAKTLEEARSQIAVLEKQLKENPTGEAKTVTVERVVEKRVEVPVPYEVRVEIPVLDSADLAKARGIADAMISTAKDLTSAAQEINARIRWWENNQNLPLFPVEPTPKGVVEAVPTPKPAPARPSRPAEPKPVANSEAVALSAPLQKIINSIAAFTQLGIEQPARAHVATWADYSPTSGGYKNYLGQLRGMGLVTYPGSDTLALTEAGKQVVSADLSPIESVEDLHQAWIARLSAPLAGMLSELIAAYPGSIAREELARRRSYSPTSGGFKNYLGALRSLGLADYPDKNSVSATPFLFPALPRKEI